MKTIVISIQVPEGVEVAVSQGAPQPTAAQWACPKHGSEKVASSKFGGWYCQAKDDSQPRGYCTQKSQ